MFEISNSSLQKKSVERTKTRALISEFMIQEKQNRIIQTLKSLSYLRKILQFPFYSL